MEVILINVPYSGTMGAAIEGAIEGTSSIGFSLCDYDPKGNFSHGLPFVVKIVKEVLRKGLPKNVALNVNIPAMSDEQIKGIKKGRRLILDGKKILIYESTLW